MAKLGSIKSNVIATAIDGIFIRDLPMKKLQEILGTIDDVAKQEEVSDNEVLLIMFRDLLCDASGEQFEDALTLEDIEDNVPIHLMHMIIEEIPKALNPGEGTMGKQQVPGKNK